MHWLTTAEGHIVIAATVVSDIVVTLAGLRSLRKKINGHINGKDDGT